MRDDQRLQLAEVERRRDDVRPAEDPAEQVAEATATSASATIER